MNDLSSLIERVKAAKEPSRELDCLIDAIVRDDREVLNVGQQILARNRKPPHDSYLVGTIDPGRKARNFTEAGGNPPDPRYTASVDAVIALIEDKLPGWKRSLFEKRGGGWIARVSSPRYDTFTSGEDDRAATAPLALLSALLTAIKEQSKWLI